MKEPVKVAVEDLYKEPFSSVLCYPRAGDAELHIRIAELRLLGVEAVEFSGKGSAFNVRVLGKGYVGIVVTAHLTGQRVAMKIRRVDADRPSLEREAEMLAKANAVKVGPGLIRYSRNFLLMQLVEGDMLPVWLENHKKKESVRRVLDDILAQCRRLDEIGLDHGELSKAPKHLIVDVVERPWIFDFETASDIRKPANVTAVCQYLFLGASPVTSAVENALGKRDRLGIMEALRLYKKDRCSGSFDQVRQISLL